MQDNTQGHVVTLKARGDYRTPYIRAGWEDARTGAPFNYALVDRAINHYAGMAYETARQLVIALRIAGERVPAWRSPNVTPTIAEAIRTAFLVNRAHIIHGSGPIVVLPKQ